MRKLFCIVAIIVGIFLGVVWSFEANIQAQETNLPDIQARLSADKWQPIWGQSFQRDDNQRYGDYLYTRNKALQTNNLNLILTQFFDNQQSQTQLNKLVEQNPKLSRRHLDTLLIRAFNNQGQVIQENGIVVDAGLFSYTEWREVPVPPNVTEFSCQHRLQDGTLIPRTCQVETFNAPSTEFVEYFMPYWRVWTDLGTPPAIEAYPASQGLYFHNRSRTDLLVSVAYYDVHHRDWGSQGWIRIAPGETRRAHAGLLHNPHFAYFVKTFDGQSLITGDRTFWVRSQNWDWASQAMDNTTAQAQGFTEQQFLSITTDGRLSAVFDIP